jgi:hypothetical protein
MKKTIILTFIESEFFGNLPIGLWRAPKVEVFGLSRG